MNTQDRVTVVRAITQELFTTLDFEERLRRILELAMESVQAEGGSILLYEPSAHSLVFRYVVGANAAKLIGLSMPADEGIAGEVFRTRQPQLTLAPNKDPRHSRRVEAAIQHRTTNLLTVPLRSAGEKEKPLGVLQVVNRKGGAFTEADLSLLETVGDIAALAIRNAHLTKDAELASIAKTLGDLSHDLKNKVNVVLGWLQTIEPSIEPLQQVDPDTYSLLQEAFEAIYAATTEVHRDTQLIADAVRGTISEARRELHPFSELVESRIHAMEPAARRHGVELKWEIEPTPPALLDRFLVERMVNNLLHNAIDAMPGGGEIRITVRHEPEGEFPTGNYLFLEVWDTGIGMPAHRLQEILEGRASSGKPAGTGLGTRIIRNAILAHDGLWEGRSEPGAGTCFQIKIPILQM